jgi:hypothetical protein
MQPPEPPMHINFSEMRLKSACVQQLTMWFTQCGGVASTGSFMDSQPFAPGGDEGGRSLMLMAAGHVVALRNDLRTFYVRHVLQQLLNM